MPAVAFPSAVTDAASGMFGLEVVECVAAASVPADDMAAVEACGVDPAPTVDGDPVRAAVVNDPTTSGARSALGSNDRTVTHVQRITVPAFPVWPGGEAHAADLSGIPGSLNA